MAITMQNVNSLVSCFGASLGGFFEFCEKQNGVKASDLNNLFNQYFAVSDAPAKANESDSESYDSKSDEDTSVSSKKTVKAAKTKTPNNTKVHQMSDSESDSDSDDEDTSVSSKKTVINAETKIPAKSPVPAARKKAPRKHEMSDSEADIKKAAEKKTPACDRRSPAGFARSPAKKPAARKPSGKNSAKPRDEQTPIPVADLNKKKLPELKDFSRERGLPVSGTKAQLIENILNYEKEQDDSPYPDDPTVSVVEEEDLGIKINKPKIKAKNKKMCEPADRPKYEVEEKHGVKMIYYNKLDGWLILNDKDVVFGWAHADDEMNAEKDEHIDIRALDKKVCEAAKELRLDFEVPENLDF